MTIAQLIAVIAFLILFVSGLIVGWYGQVVVARAYAAKHAIRYGTPPPYSLFFSTPLGDPEVEAWRKRNIKYQTWSAGLLFLAFIALLVAATYR